MRSIILTLCLAMPVQAETPCLPLPQFLQGLEDRYDETPRMSGLAGAQLLIITASEAGTWTAVLVNPDGSACIASAGEAFVIAPTVAPGVLN